MKDIRSMRRQHVVYTLKDMETGDKVDLHEFRTVGEGLRKPGADDDKRFRIVSARIVGVY